MDIQLASACLTLAFALATNSTHAAPPSKPNILIILADDLGYGSMTCYGANPKFIQTPSCDRLSREGVRFTDATTPASVCSPTRYGLLTGRYCWRTSLKYEVLGMYSPLHIEKNRLTLPSMLKTAGYRTAAIGKWHLGFGTTEPVKYTEPLRPGPLDVGFDYFYGIAANHGDMTGVYLENDLPLGIRSKKLAPYGKTFYGPPYLGIDAPQRKEDEVMANLTDKVIHWIGSQESKTPFFLYYAPVAVHHPSTPSAKTRGTSGCGEYGDWIHEFDLSVGRILEALEKNHQAENTLVIVTSDNGGVVDQEGETAEAKAYALGFRACGAWRGRKHSIYEGGFRVPYIARWPGKIKPGRVCAEPINLVDTLATMAALVDVPLPAKDQAAEDSFNLLPLLLGQEHQEPARPYLILHSAAGVYAVRQGPWKWIEGKPVQAKQKIVSAAEFTPQLYNLIDDPGETKNLVASQPEIAKRLQTLLDQYRQQPFSRP